MTVHSKPRLWDRKFERVVEELKLEVNAELLSWTFETVISRTYPSGNAQRRKQGGGRVGRSAAPASMIAEWSNGEGSSFLPVRPRWKIVCPMLMGPMPPVEVQWIGNNR